MGLLSRASPADSCWLLPLCLVVLKYGRGFHMLLWLYAIYIEKVNNKSRKVFPYKFCVCLDIVCCK